MDVSIVIPTKNGGDLFGKVLNRVFEQKTKYTFEVICVDSGSTDNTINIIKNSDSKLYCIEPSEFGHGRTRNYGASMGTGEFIVFLTQDALPVDEKWLDELIDAMKLDDEIAGGFGAHIPYTECNVFDARNIINHFKGFGTKNTIYKIEDQNRYCNDEGYRHMLAFFSDNNSCLRRSVWEQYPYDDVDFSEDQIWAKRMIELGYKKVYCPNAKVYHSHNYPLKTYFSRYYDEYKGLYNIHQYTMANSLGKSLKNAVAEIKSDVKYVMDNNNNISKKFYWIYYGVVRDLYKNIAGYIGGMYHGYPKEVKFFFDKVISQQYKQIRGKEVDTEKIKWKSVLKWMLFRQDVQAEKKNITLQNKVNVFKHYDFILNESEVPFSNDDYEKNKAKKIINWVIPEMNVGSGGHINIFRFVNYMQDFGFENHVYINKAINFKNDLVLRDFLTKHYSLDISRVQVHADISDMKFAHAVVATSWDTAYTVKRFNNTISKFYFVQDFEPYFYPLGSEYVFAENTYKFGFRGITAGDWLKNKLREEYGMKTESFLFSYDHDMYKPGVKKDNIKRIFFYARPVTPRRAFELGIMALYEISKKIPDIEVVFAGWDVSQYQIPFKHSNLGSVNVSKLSEIYSQCDVCLVISNTNLSLLPLEVMASNSVVVGTNGENSTWLVNEENSIIVDFNVQDIANKVVYYLEHEDELAIIREKGLKFAQQTSWDNEAIKVRNAFIKGIEEDEKSISSRW